MNILVVSSSVIFDKYTDGNTIIQTKMIGGMARNGDVVTLLMYAPFASKKEGETNVFQNLKSYVYPVNIKILSLASLSKIFHMQFYSLACAYVDPFSKFKERLKKIISENEINLILCQNVSNAPAIQRYIKEIPVVIVAHDVLVDRYREIFKYRRTPKVISNTILKWLQEIEIKEIKNASYTVCLSKEDEIRFVELGVPQEKITTITGGSTDVEKFCPIPPEKNLQKKLGLTGKEPILFFGGADSLQNVTALENIVKYILPPVIEECPDIKMLFTGTLSKVASREKLEERFPGSIINAGFVNDLELYYSIVDIVILPITIGSGIRLKVAEAMAAGKPIISTQKGIMGYNIKNNEHVIIEDDIRLFPKQIKKLLKDPSFRENLGRKAREFMLNYDWKVMMDEYQKIYQKVLNQGICF